MQQFPRIKVISESLRQSGQTRVAGSRQYWQWIDANLTVRLPLLFMGCIWIQPGSAREIHLSTRLIKTTSLLNSLLFFALHHSAHMCETVPGDNATRRVNIP